MSKTNISLDIDGGTTSREFPVVGETNGTILFETRDQDKRSLESSMTLSSTHLASNATKVSAKLILQSVTGGTENVPAEASAQSMVKLDVIISDDATVADRAKLAYMLQGLAKELQPNIATLAPIYL